MAQDLTQRFAGSWFPAELAGALHRHTDGHPLFNVSVADDLVRQGRLREVGGRWEVRPQGAGVDLGVPQNLRQMIEQQFEQLSAEDQQVLEAASVAGGEFSAAVVSAGLGMAVEAVEARCEALAQRGRFLHASGVAAWPDGTVVGSYGFRHVLSQHVVYERLPAGRRTRLHQRIGLREETGFGAQASERAAKLAVHFERGRDYVRAVH